MLRCKSSLSTPIPCKFRAVDKIVLNMGLGEGVADKKKVAAAIEELTLIAGQKPVATVAKKSIAGFKLRDGMVIGAKGDSAPRQVCLNSWIVSSTSLCRVCVTSGV